MDMRKDIRNLDLSSTVEQPLPYPKSPTNERIRKEKTNDPSIDRFRRLDFVDDNDLSDMGFQGGSQKRSRLQLTLWSWLSVSIDALILIAISCFFVITFAFLMKSTSNEMLVFIQNQMLGGKHAVIKFFAISFICSFWIYLIFMRVFNGATLGEMTCYLRLGQPMQRLASSYILRVLLRTTLIMLSGIIVIPTLSLIFQKDIAGEITGIKLYSLI